jgi:hypothetical protein
MDEQAARQGGETGEHPPPLERVVEGIEAMRAAYPTMSLSQQVEAALEYAAVVLVDSIGPGQEPDLDAALRQWLTHTRAPSGAFGQSMENTMAYDTTRRLRSVAAAHIGSPEHQ